MCAEALLYIWHGDKLVERHGLWLFPGAQERFLVASHEGVDEFYILVRFEGKACLDKISLGVCKKADGTFGPSSLTEGAPSVLEPTEGHVVRIVSIEQDGEPLQHPEDASPFLLNARHIHEVIRKQAGKRDTMSSFETLHAKFGVLRTLEYMEAKKAMESDDCGSAEWETALAVLEDPLVFPWKLANRVAQLGCQHKLADAEHHLMQGGMMHIAENIWLVDESLPLTSHEFAVAARWAVQKSLHGTGSIPRAQMWEPVTVLTHDDTQSVFQLMRMA